MKGDVGMSLHEKERNKKMPTPRHKVTHNPIPTSLFCFNMLLCSEGLARLSRRVWRRFVRGSREISLVPSLHRASTDTLIELANRGA